MLLGFFKKFCNKFWYEKCDFVRILLNRLLHTLHVS